VITLDARDTLAGGVAVAEGRVLAVGTREDMLALRGPRTEVTELGGRALLPGFVDAHSHLHLTAEKLATADLCPAPLGPIRCIADLQHALGGHARREKIAPGDWIVGMGYDDTAMAEGRHPTRDDLDPVSSEHPILVFHVSGHFCAANSRALAAGGVDATTLDPPGGVVRRRAGGAEPDGVFEEAAMVLMRGAMPRLADAEIADRLVRAAHHYAAHGITTAQEAALLSVGVARVLGDLAGEGRLPIDVVAYPIWTCADAIFACGADRQGPAGSFRLGGLKLILDGSIQGYTGYLSRPYHVAPGDARPGTDACYCGYPFMGGADEVAAWVAKAFERGLPLHAHCNGDAAVDLLIEAVRRATNDHPGVDRRTVIVHAQTIREDQLDAACELGLVPSFFPSHVYYWGDRHLARFLGPDRAPRISPMRSAQRRGMRFTIHTDSPVVPVDPLHLLWTAVNRVTAAGVPLGPDQRIGVAEALRAMTIDSAWVLFEESQKGSIEPGKLADFVVLSEDPLAVDPMRLRALQVVETIKAGRTIHAA